MTAELSVIQELHRDLHFLKAKIINIELNVEEINQDLHHVRPEYLQKLEKIKQGKSHHFETKEAFLHFLHHEV